jgi:DNA-binding NtrC family response regulator
MTLEERIQENKKRHGIIGFSAELDRAIETALRVAPTNEAVLIVGENGVGKENIARIIQENSARKHNNFISINCGSIPEGTIDSELFGHEKGSFTGAADVRQGYFESANGGTLFLDEVGEMPLGTQARLLRVLETGQYLRVGSSTVRTTDVRIIAATNADLRDSVARGKFRADLYFRISTIPIRVPALRERKGDILPLFAYFAVQAAEKFGGAPIELTDNAKEFLENYSWPGNIRQLKHLAEQLSLVEPTRNITRDILEKSLADTPTAKFNVAVVPASHEQNYDYNHDALVQEVRQLRGEVDFLKQLFQEIIIRQSGNRPSTSETYHPNLLTNKKIETNSEEHIEEPEFVTPTIVSNDEAEDKNENETIAEATKEKIIATLKKHNGQRRAAAQELGISERTLYRKIIKYGL